MRAAYTNEVRGRTELETFLRKALDDVRQDVAARRKRRVGERTAFCRLLAPRFLVSGSTTPRFAHDDDGNGSAVQTALSTASDPRFLRFVRTTLLSQARRRALRF